MTIQYTIQPSHPEAHLYTVTLHVTTPDPSGQRLSLPAWIPGSYMIRDFARNVVKIRASDGAGSVVLQKLDKNTWVSPAGMQALTVTYDVYAWDLSVRAAHLDMTHGFFNGTSVFLCVEGQEDQSCTLTVEPPLSSALNDWGVATSLPSVTVDDHGFGDYCAHDYDDLIDHPVEMGTFERVVFNACGTEHELVLTGKYTTDTYRICRDLTIICEHHIRFFGEPAPVDRYVFLVMVVGDGYGGLEHRASTSLLVKRDHLPIPGDESVSDNYLEFLGLCSHEYFHTWNVKRIKPARFVPYELGHESYTTLLWAFEGITSYYDDLALVQTGLIDRERYLVLLGRTVTRVYRGSGRLIQSVADSSFDAWTKFYKQDENAPNAIVSYYAKGAIVAFCLDMLIRKTTNGDKTLDDLMRILWNNYQTTGEGIAEHDIEQLTAELCGADVSDFFKQAVFGTDDLPLVENFGQVGVDLTFRSAEGQDDKGGTPAGSDRAMLTLGMRTTAGNGGLNITHVFDNGPAQRAGLSAGDTLIALDKLSVRKGALPRQLRRHQAGDTLIAHVFRRDELLELPITLAHSPEDTCVLTINEEQNLTDTWLGKGMQEGSEKT